MAKLNYHRSDREARVFRQGHVHVTQDTTPDLVEGGGGGHVPDDTEQCPYCGTICLSPFLKDHVAKMHGKPVPLELDNPFRFSLKIPDCERQFIQDSLDTIAATFWDKREEPVALEILKELAFRSTFAARGFAAQVFTFILSLRKVNALVKYENDRLWLINKCNGEKYSLGPSIKEAITNLNRLWVKIIPPTRTVDVQPTKSLTKIPPSQPFAKIAPPLPKADDREQRLLAYHRKELGQGCRLIIKKQNTVYSVFIIDRHGRKSPECLSATCRAALAVAEAIVREQSR